MRFSKTRESLTRIINGAALSLLLFAVGIMAFGTAVEAATNAPALTGNGKASGLSVSPLRQNITLKPGQADKIDVTLKNITGGPVIAKTKVVDFVSDNNTGNPKLITNTNKTSPNSIRNFLIGLGNIPLATGQTTSFAIPVQAPNNSSPGAYYGIIEYQAVPVNANGTTGTNVVALSAAVSQLVFITVPGVTNDRLQLNAVHVYSDKQGTDDGIFFNHVPKSVGVEIQNIGNAFATPFGNVTIQSTTGKKIFTYELNGGITRGLVLPNSTRIFKNPIHNISRPGRYTVNVSASYGPGSTILIGKKSFWYVPIWLMIVIIIIILILIGVVWLIVRRYRRTTNRHQRQ